jgi:hypothetical protein
VIHLIRLSTGGGFDRPFSFGEGRQPSPVSENLMVLQEPCANSQRGLTSFGGVASTALGS